MAKAEEASGCARLKLSLTQDAILRFIVPLGVVGFITPLAGTLLVGWWIAANTGGVVVLVVLLCFALLSAWQAYAAKETTGRVMRVALGLLSIVGGIIAAAVRESFHCRASTLNRASVYSFVLVALFADIATLWPVLWALPGLSREYLNDVDISPDDEKLLYVALQVGLGWVVSFFVALPAVADRSRLMRAGLANACGWWFIGALLAAAIGASVVYRAHGNLKALRPASAGTALDKQPLRAGARAEDQGYESVEDMAQGRQGAETLA